MVRVALYERGERVGYVDTATGETAYDGDDRAVELFLADVNGGLTEVVPGDADDADPLATTRTVTGEELCERVIDVLEGLGVDCEIEETTGR